MLGSLLAVILFLWCVIAWCGWILWRVVLWIWYAPERLIVVGLLVYLGSVIAALWI